MYTLHNSQWDSVGRDAWRQIQEHASTKYEALFVPDAIAANIVNINGHVICMKVRDGCTYNSRASRNTRILMWRVSIHNCNL
jgi:hypothetical protein